MQLSNLQGLDVQDTGHSCFPDMFPWSMQGYDWLTVHQHKEQNSLQLV
jgi:hypothetical protein